MKSDKSHGITLDDKLFFNSHVNNVCKAANLHIRASRYMRGSRCITRRRLAWWQVRWLAPVSTTVTPFSMEHPPEILGSCNETSTRSHGWCPVRRWAIRHWTIRHCGLVGSAPAWDGTGCEFDSWQCRIYIPCSLNLRLLGSLRGSLGTYGLTQKLCC